jgi:hypothetical protein
VTSRKIGDRVGVPWVQASCGRCEWCQRGKRMFCARNIFIYTSISSNNEFEDKCIPKYSSNRSNSVSPYPIERRTSRTKNIMNVMLVPVQYVDPDGPAFNTGIEGLNPYRMQSS